VEDLMAEEIVTKKVNAYVIQALDEFGKQKWGMGGFPFKSRNYKIYYRPPKKLETGMILNPEWIIISNKMALEAKAQGRGRNVYKYPGYTVTLNPEAMEILGYVLLSVRYGGYNNITDYEVASDDISGEFSEEALDRALSEILTKGYEPHTVFDLDLEKAMKVK
jgi:hypothetical protein